MWGDFDGVTITDRRELSEMLWHYVDGMGGGRPSTINLTNQMIEHLQL